MAETYQKFEDEPSQGPVLNETVPPTRVVKRSRFKRPRCLKDGFQLIVLGCILFCVAITIALSVDIAMRNKHKSLVSITTDDPHCTKISVDLFKKTKANAVDAAVAAMVCLTVTKPDETSLASGGYMLIHSKETTQTIDFQFLASKFYNHTSEEQKKLPVAVPGFVEGMRMVHKRYGKIPWNQLISPSINLAKQGFSVSKRTAKNIADYYDSKLPQNMKDLFSTDGRSVKAGETLKMPKLADSLEFLMKEDTKQLDKDILQTVNKNNLNWTEESMVDFVRMNATALSASFGDLEVYSTFIPSSGVSIISGLEILNKLQPSFNLTTYYYELAKTIGEVLSVREQFEDVYYFKNRIKILEHIKKLQEVLRNSDKKAVEIRNSINNKRPQSPSSDQNADGELSSAKVTVIDHDGEIVSMASSLGHVFGSKVMTKNGIILNDGIRMFRTTGEVNVPGPQLRPPSFSAPLIAFKGKGHSKERFAFAGSADMKGLAALLQVLNNRLLQGMSLSESMSKARIFYNPFTNYIAYEGGQGASSSEAGEELRNLFTPVAKIPTNIGHVICSWKNEKTTESYQR